MQKLDKETLERIAISKRTERHQKMLEHLQVENYCLKVCVQILGVLCILTLFLQVVCLLWWVD